MATRLNQQFHKTLNNLSKDDTLTVTRYDKGNGVCLMNKKDYLEKLDKIVNDKTKFNVIEKSKRKNARHPILKRQEDIKKLIDNHVKTFVDADVSKSLKPSGTGAGRAAHTIGGT